MQHVYVYSELCLPLYCPGNDLFVLRTCPGEILVTPKQSRLRRGHGAVSIYAYML